MNNKPSWRYHEDKVTEIAEQNLRPESKAASSAAHSMGHVHHLHRRLNNMECNLHPVKEEVESLTLTPGLDSYLLLQWEE